MMHTYLNNLIKKLIVFIVVFTTTTCNTSFAFDEYFKITNSVNKAKSINVDLSSVVVEDDIVTFYTKYNKGNNITIINKISVNTYDKTIKKVRQDILDNSSDEVKSLDFSDTNQFKQIKDGTLMADLYDVAVSLKLSSETFSQNPKVWQKYFKQVANRINRQYHPNILRWKQGIETEDKDVLVIVLVNKSGKILSYKYENKYPVKYPKFDKKYKEHVEKIFLKNDKIFPPLPKEYNGEKIIMKFRIRYVQNEDYKTYKNKKNAGKFDFNKKSMPLCYLPLWTISLTKATGALGIFIVSIPLCIIAPGFVTSKIYDKF